MGYQSKYGTVELTPAKYITELMCERKAYKEKKTLTQKFWRNDYWKPFYAQQILAANSLLKIYSEQAILAALKNKQVSWVYSLRAPQLQPIIADEQNKINRAKKLAEEQKVLDAVKVEELNIEKVDKVRESTNTNSTFKKLRDL
jgi:hypothetical protein